MPGMRYWYCELPPQLVCNTSPPYLSPSAPSPPLLPFFAAQLQSQRSHSRSRSHHRCRRRGRRRSRSLPFIIALLARQSGVSWPPCSLSLALSACKYVQSNIHTHMHTYLFIHVRMRVLLSLSLRRRLLSVYACMCVPTSVPPSLPLPPTAVSLIFFSPLFVCTAISTSMRAHACVCECVKERAHV